MLTTYTLLKKIFGMKKVAIIKLFGNGFADSNTYLVTVQKMYNNFAKYKI